MTGDDVAAPAVGDTVDTRRYGPAEVAGVTDGGRVIIVWIARPGSRPRRARCVMAREGATWHRIARADS